MGRISFKQLVNNASRSLVINRSQPQFITYSSSVLSSSSYNKSYYDRVKHKQIPSSSLFDGFIKTTRRFNRFYKRTFAEYVPSSMLVRPDWSRETDEAVHFYVGMCGVGDEDIKISVEKNKTVTIIGQGDGVFEAQRGFKKYVCYIDLPDIDSPDKIYTTRGIKADMIYYTSTVELVIPKLKQHEKQDADDDDDQRNTFNVNVNRTFHENEDYYSEDDDEDDDDDDQDNDYNEDDHSLKVSPSSFYAYMSSLINVVRLPLIINKCVDISSQLFLSTINDGQHHRLNVAINSISNFIYTNIMNRFGLFDERVYSMTGTRIEPSLHETDEFLNYYLQLNGVMSHENVTIKVYYNKLSINGAVYDEFKATHHLRICDINLQPEDSYYLKYNMRDIKADYSQGDGELKLIIPKFDATQRMINEKKKEAGEFSKLKDDAFMFNIKVNATI